MSHKINFYTGVAGWETELECPEDCTDKEWHEESWAEYGYDVIRFAEERTLIGSIPVIAEEEGTGEDAELYLNPVVES